MRGFLRRVRVDPREHVHAKPVDILYDIMIFGLVIAVANAVEEQQRQISLGIAQEVEFSLPPSFTVHDGGDFAARQDTGRVPRAAGDGLHRPGRCKGNRGAGAAIRRPSARRLRRRSSVPSARAHSHSATTDALAQPLLLLWLRFYYGDFCQYCFYYRDYAWLKRMWWRGGGMAATADRDSAPAPAVTRYKV